MNIYERLQELCKKKGVTIKQMEIDNNISRGHAYKWKTSTPTAEKIAQLAEYFGVTQEYILTGEDHDADGYYLDPETARLAEELKNNTELKALFDVARDMTPDRLEAIYNLVKKM